MTRKSKEAVVLDTNSWVYGTRMLRSPLAVAFLYSAAKRRTVLLLPEVVEKEIYAIIGRDCRAASAQVIKGLAELQHLLGRQIPDPRLPDEKVVAALVKERLAECREVTQPLPLTIVQARRALERVYHKTAPCDRTEEFRDAVIWEVVREAAGDHTVFFVTRDAAFYRDRDYKKGMAESLAADIHPDSVVLCQDLTVYLERCGVSPSFPSKKRLAATLDTAAAEWLYAMDSERTIELIRLKQSKLQPFLTDRPDRIAYQFSFIYAGRSYINDGEPPEDCDIQVWGEALVGRDLSVVDLELDSIQVGGQPEVSFAYSDDRYVDFDNLAPLSVRVAPRRPHRRGPPNFELQLTKAP